MLLQIVILLIINTKYSLVILNMIARTYERVTLQFFLIFQQNHTLESLDLARDMFKKREQVHARMYFWLSLLTISPFYVVILIPGDHRLETILMVSSWYLIIQLVLVTGHYITTEVPLMLDM